MGGTVYVGNSDTTYSNATTSAAGLMSAADKTKLDGVETSADVTDTTNVVAALTAGTNITIASDGTISSSASGGGGASYSDPIRQTEYTGTATNTFNASSTPALPAFTVGNIQVFSTVLNLLLMILRNLQTALKYSLVQLVPHLTLLQSWNTVRLCFSILLLHSLLAPHPNIIRPRKYSPPVYC